MDAISLIGRRFGRLVVVSDAPREPGRGLMLACLCDCGGTKVAVKTRLIAGSVTSCGCARRERAKTLKPTLSHGLSEHRLFKVWRAMLERCTNPDHHAYARYGGRGIGVCERWESLAYFIEDMWPSFVEGLTLDRQENALGYSPENCRWVTRRVQNNNRENTPRLTHDGQTRSLADWARAAEIPHRILSWRKAAGWSDERALTTPVRPKRR